MVQGDASSLGMPMGGGLLNAGAITLTNVSISGNSATSGGGLYNSGTGSLTLTNTTLETNTATTVGGGIHNDGLLISTGGNLPNGLTLNAQGSSRVLNVAAGRNVTVVGLTLFNGSATDGGGVFNSGTLVLVNATIEGNRAPGTVGTQGGGIFNNGDLTVESLALTTPSRSTTWGCC